MDTITTTIINSINVNPQGFRPVDFTFLFSRVTSVFSLTFSGLAARFC
jgi:hypothetical protein